MEIWKDIEGYEGKYQISNEGRIKSLLLKFGKQETKQLMTPQETWNGYLRIVLYKDKKPKIFSVHRLVAQAFIPNPKNLPVVNHINGNRKDNRS